MIDIPDIFRYIPYNALVNPDNPPKDFLDLTGGSNCLIFTYAILKYFHYKPPIFWSIEFWNDTEYTKRVEDYKEFDILLYGNNDVDHYWSHLALYLGDNKIIHLSKEVGFPEILDYQELVNRWSYKYILGAKRLI